MSINKNLRIASFVVLIAIAIPASSAMIAPEILQMDGSAKTENPKVQELSQRLEYINGMTKSEMTRMERKNLRKEVKGIKKEMKAMSGGVYLSVAAIIIIILVLILIL